MIIDKSKIYSKPVGLYGFEKYMRQNNLNKEKFYSFT